MSLAPGTLLTTFGPGLARVVRAGRRGRAPGYDVSEPDSPYTRFCPDWIAEGRVAVVGKTVCAKPYFSCFCGLTHVREADLRILPVAPQEAEPCP